MTKHEAVEILEEVKTLDDSMFTYSQAYNDALDMAIDALKAQEPRVMTLEEASNSTVPMWFEKSGDECGWITGIDCSPIQATTIGQVDGDDWYNLPITDYGRLWRCWTSRPDEKRMAETSWE